MKKGMLVSSLLFILSIMMAFGCQPPEAETNALPRLGLDYLWYGINQYYKEANLPTLASYRSDLNAGLVRFDVYWYFIEPTQGNFDWTKTDAIINALPSDVDLLFTIYCTAPWAIKARPGIPITNIMPPTAPNQFSDYYNFVRALAARYTGRVKYYQIENEVYGAQAFWMGTPAEYVTLLQTGHNAIQATDPSALVLPASIAFGTLDVTQPIPPAYQDAVDFIHLVYSSGAAYFDIADVHLYYTLASIPDRLQWFKTLMSGYGYTKPIWVTETGGLDYRAYIDPTDAAEQSLDLVKRFVLCWAGAAERVFWLCVHKEKDVEVLPGADIKLTEDSAALLKKPAYYTLKLLIGKLDGFTEVTPVNGGYKFTVRGKPVLVLWNDTPTTVAVSAHIPAATVRVTHIITGLAHTDPLVQTRAADAVPVGPEPVFVEE